jgi:DNA-directed RNA polymerase subunit RPC12/RpoP
MTPAHVPVDSADAREQAEPGAAEYVSGYRCLACGQKNARITQHADGTYACYDCQSGPLLRARV